MHIIEADHTFSNRFSLALMHQSIETDALPRPPELSGELNVGLVLKPRYFSRSPSQDVC